MSAASPPGDLKHEAAALADWLEGQGSAEAAERARRLRDRLAGWESDVLRRAGDALAIHHDIRNALTGVLGNAQLVLMGPAAELPGVRRRLDSLVHEAERIREFAERLHRARAQLAVDDVPVRPPASSADAEAA